MITIAAQRLFTFALNTALLRYVSADDIGFANADMELLLATILLTREASTLIALRVNMATILPAMFTKSLSIDTSTVTVSSSTPRSKEKSSSSSGPLLQQQRFTNLTWLPVLFGIMINALLLAVFYYHSSSSSSSSTPASTTTTTEQYSLVLFCFAALLETIAGPFVIYCQSLLLMNGRALTDIIAMLVKCITIFILAAYFRLGVLAYAIGQVFYASTILCGFFRTLIIQPGMTLSILYPRWINVPASHTVSWLSVLGYQIGDNETSLFGAFTIQSIVKYLLTEGDRLLMTLIATRSSRGVYSTVTNYGSLAARLLFQPLEENMRNIVSKLVIVSDQSLSLSSSSSDKNTTIIHQNNRIAIFIFYGLLRIVFLIGLFFSILGPIYAPIASNLLLGKRLNYYPEFIEALSMYCVYVTFMALNGVTEAFATGAATQTRIKQSSVHMTIAFILSSICIYQLMPIYGLVGLILANSINMLIRTVSSLLYIRSIVNTLPPPILPHTNENTDPNKVWYGILPMAALPSFVTLFGFIITAVDCWYIRLYWGYDLFSVMDSVKFIVIGMVHIVILFGILYKYERKQILQTWRILKGKIDPRTLMENDTNDRTNTEEDIANTKKTK